MNLAPTVRLIAIVGGSGSGKTWLASRLHQLLGETATRLSLDNFYRDRSHLPPFRRSRVNFDHPASIDWPLFERVFHDCATRRPTESPRYDFGTHCRSADREPLSPQPVVLVEGLWVLSRPVVRRRFHLKIFLDCPQEVRLRRRLIRDVNERGRSPAETRRQFRTIIVPMHRRYVAPQARWADLVLVHPYSGEQLCELHEQLWNLVNRASLLPAWMRETFRAELSVLLNGKEPDS